MPEMTAPQINSFLRDPHVGVLAIERKSNPPLAVPIWYDVDDAGDVFMWMDEDSLKAKLLRKAGRATYTVQQATDGYSYVSLEGRVTFLPPDIAVLQRLAVRYLGPDVGSAYVENSTEDGAVIVIVHADKVRSFDFRE
ncbi:pyridoxamine 5'-phosphate oxidase [Gordonia spumicola]|uniref:Pyridoxamine 5'-phosphate oxidase n=1 Tax=Gordonia spumicola TaxID=589161 RepID=A0A7I9V707_9ACTN|nr:pyridoxamine 5'-phosphate oxidase family protein [Gordonia spumicola]GEE00863.1 pyridoxamine 5'-phosphate oxidase [Gordonia spumicola]